MPITPYESPEAFVVMNPVAGLINYQITQRLIELRFHAAGWTTHFFITQPDSDVTGLVREQVEKGIDLVVAVGGDGTIAEVAAGLIHSSTPLGIIPHGTWNAIARHLTLPFNPLRAISLMIGKHQIRHLDMMSIGDKIHAMNLSVGFSTMMIKTTTRENKHRFGNLAYFNQLLKQVFGLQLRRYKIIADGRTYKGRATEIMVANYGVVGVNRLENMLDIHPDDGKVDVLILKTRTIVDLPSIFWQTLIKHKKRIPKFQQLLVNNTLTIEMTPRMDVQADGEMIGKTPVTLEVLPRCVQVIVPK